MELKQGTRAFRVERRLPKDFDLIVKAISTEEQMTVTAPIPIQEQKRFCRVVGVDPDRRTAVVQWDDGRLQGCPEATLAVAPSPAGEEGEQPAD